MTADSVLDRLKFLERLVQDLTGELERARGTSTTAVSSSGIQPSGTPSTAPAATTEPGRVVLDGPDRVRYVSGAFWSHVDRELDSLKEDTQGFENEGSGGNLEGVHVQSNSSPSTAEADRSSLDRYAWLLKHNSSFARHENSTLFPLASQIPYLLEIYSERVQSIIALPYMPPLKKLFQNRRNGRLDNSSPGEVASLFSVFYAAICSLDDNEVITSFNVTKDELVLKYRIGLEQALAEADFLENPSDTLIQALVIFLTLARRQDSPRYLWMMIGLAIRMAHYLGLHRDAFGSKHRTPFQVEVQRRIWWNLCILDVQATNDQGTELAIPQGSYSTRMPSNINDADIWPGMEQPPAGRQGPTDVTMFRLCSKFTRHTQEMLAVGATATANDLTHRLSGLTQELDREYFSQADKTQDPSYVAAAGFMRIALGRLTILAYRPVLCSSPGVNFSAEMRAKLLVAAIDVIEHNHALNADARYQHLRWVFQTQLHLHAVVFLLIELCRRPWSSTVERAWIALQSPWLVPPRASTDKNSSVLFPLRSLMIRARKHRESELARLQTDSDAAAKVEMEDRKQIPTPSSSATFPAYFEDESFNRRWRQLVYPVVSTTTNTFSGTGSRAPDLRYTTNVATNSGSSLHGRNAYEPTPVSHSEQLPSETQPNDGLSFSVEPWPGAPIGLTDCEDLSTFLGADTDMESTDIMDDQEFLNFDWNSWIESAKSSW